MGTISQSQNVLYNLPGIGLSVCDGGGELSINHNAFLEDAMITHNLAFMLFVLCSWSPIYSWYIQ